MPVVSFRRMKAAGTQRLWIRLALSAVPLVLLALHALDRLPLGFVERAETYLYDLRVQLSLPGGVDPRVVIVDIDERSIGVEGRWPWRRDRLAALVNQLFDQYGVRALGFDVVFPESDDRAAVELLDRLDATAAAATPEGQAALAAERERQQTDQAFAEALIARDAVLGVVFKQRVVEGEPAKVGTLPAPVALTGEDVARVPWLAPAGYTGNLGLLTENATTGGFFDTPIVDEDGKVRRAPLFQRYDGALYESLALAVTRIALGNPPLTLGFARDRGEFSRLEYVRLGERNIPVDREGAVLIPFRGDVGSFPYVAATDVLTGAAPAELLRDRIVLVGTSAPGLVDIRATPVSKLYVGVEAHANLVAGMLDGAIRFRPAFAPTVELAVLILLALATSLWLPRLAPLAGLLWTVVLLAAMSGANWAVWHYAGLWLPLASPVVLVLAAALLQLTWGYFVETRRKRRLGRLFGQYVPAEIVRELDQSDADVSVEGESREMSVLFSDVRGFTTLSEWIEPRELTRLMNAFLTPITEVIQRERGTIDNYMGDAGRAFWGAPLADPDHAANAVRAALALVERVGTLEAEFRSRGWPAIRVGVGISTGPMNVGNMGSQFRMAYTVLGDTVNLGSRLESLTKQYGVSIAVSAATAAAAPEFLYREIDLVRVKGKHEPVGIFEPLGPLATASEASRHAAARLADALARYRAGDWDRAESLLDSLDAAAPHPLYAIYRERIAHFRRHPPPPDWDGVFVHESK